MDTSDFVARGSLTIGPVAYNCFDGAPADENGGDTNCQRQLGCSQFLKATEGGWELDDSFKFVQYEWHVLGMSIRIMYPDVYGFYECIPQDCWVPHTTSTHRLCEACFFINCFVFWFFAVTGKCPRCPNKQILMNSTTCVCQPGKFQTSIWILLSHGNINL